MRNLKAMQQLQHERRRSPFQAAGATEYKVYDTKKRSCLKIWIIIIIFIAAVMIWMMHEQWSSNPALSRNQDVEATAKDMDEKCNAKHPIIDLKWEKEEGERAATHGMVAADSTICAVVGRNIMKIHDGNAFDAAIAVSFCLGVVAPYASGIGGGGFMMIKEKNEQGYGIDFREAAPLSASVDMFEDNIKASKSGAKSIAVLSEIAGLAMLHKRHGTVPWQDLIEPSILLAECGFKLPAIFATRLTQFENMIRKYPDLAELFIKEDNTIYQEGDIMRFPKLARTYRQIAKEGPQNAIYSSKSPIGRDILDELHQMGSIIQKEDFKRYKPRIMETSRISFRNRYNIESLHAPSSGGVTLMALKILDALPEPKDDAQQTHFMIEALKHAFSHRSYIGDGSPRITQHWLMDDQYIQSLASKIKLDKSQSNWKHYEVFDGERQVKPHDTGTANFNIVDRHRNAISYTTTVNHAFGSKLVGPKTGIFYNNHMNDFSVSMSQPNEFGFYPAAANAIAPEKRPLSSISPYMVYLAHNDKLVIVGGASGGPTIIAAAMQTLLPLLKSPLTYSSSPSKLSPQSVVSAPRVHIIPFMSKVRYEKGFSQLDRLRLEYGYHFRLQSRLKDGHLIGNSQVIVIDEDTSVLRGGADPRKYGRVASY